MGKQVIRFGILFAFCLTFISACTSTAPTTAPMEATVAALSTQVAQQGTIVSYLSTRVDASRAGTPTPIGFVPTKTPWLTPSPISTSAFLIEYSWSGGIAGIIGRLTIDANGRVTLTQRGTTSEFNLTGDELNQLQSSLRDTNFTSIPENSLPKQLVPDEFSYTLTYANHTVKTSDTAMPKQLQPVIKLLNAIIVKAK